MGDKTARGATICQDDLSAAHCNVRDDAVFSDRRIGFATGFNGAKTIGTGCEPQRKSLGRLRRYLALEFDVGSAALAEQTEFAFGKRPPVRWRCRRSRMPRRFASPTSVRMADF